VAVFHVFSEMSREKIGLPTKGRCISSLTLLIYTYVNFQPCMSKRLTRECIEWRIRNLPYPIDTYEVLADNAEHCIVVKTSNKKFFKKIPVPDLQRVALPIQQAKINKSHKFNTLIISVSPIK